VLWKEGANIEAKAVLDWSQCPAVESIPGKVSGAWVFRDTRLPVATVIENLGDLSVEELMEQFEVTREQIVAVLEFVGQSLKAPALTNEELSEKTVDAPDEGTPPPTNDTGAVVLAALQARPYPDIDLTPPRVRLNNVRDVVL